MPHAMPARAAPRFGAFGAPYVQPVAARPLPHPQLLYLNTAFASAYAGYQFDAWVPQLGDDRVLTLAEWQAPDGGPVELQLKGAGPTP